MILNGNIDTDCEPNTTPQGDGITPLDDVTPLDYAFDDTYSTPPDYAITPPDYAFDDTYSTPPDYAITPPDYAFDDTYSTPPDYAITPPDYAFDDTYSTPPDYVITPPDYAFDDTYSTPPDYVITPPDYAFDDTYSTPPDYAITPPDDAITLPDYAITPPDDAITPPVDTGSSHRDMHENCTQNETSQWVCDFEKQRKQGVAPVEILSRVRERLVNATENIRGGDIHRSIRLLSRLVEDQEHRFSNNSQQMKKEEAIRFAETMISIGNALLKNHTDSAWRSIPEDHRSEVASGILDSSERAAILLARVVPYKTHWIANENIVMAIKNGTTRPATFPDLGNSSFWADVKDGITLPRTQHHVISAIYRNVGQYFKPKSVNRTVNSRIISATLVNTTLVNGNSSTGPSIDGNVTIVLEHTEQTSNGSTLCVFWDVFHGNWSGEGCTTATTNTTHTICECNHLTSFAILLDTTGQHSTIGEQHSFALSVITYIGCIISIVCLFFCICVFLGFRRVRCTRTIIHANLCICLLVAEVVFLAAVDKTENAVVCDVIAIVLHYLFLAVFTWMCVEGVELYVLLVKVFNLKMNRLIYYHLVGYGAPALAVAISVTYNHFVDVNEKDKPDEKDDDDDGYFDGYGTDTYCWLSVNNYFIWSFVGPMLIVVLVNVGFLAMTMRVIYTQKAHDRSNQSEQGMEFKFWIRVSLALVCILGLTWVFGVLYISSETLVFAYVFTVINSLQGLFIFIFHCLLNEMVQDEIERRFGVRCPCWSKKKRQKTAKRQSRRTARAPQQQEIWLGDFTDTKDSHSSTHGSLQTNMSSEDTLDKLDDEGFVENSIYEDGAGTEGSVDNVIYKAGGPA
ncbi:PREDICTED: adhesion G protein-coupled receptor L3-like [Branchiostoma belcheri]|uniref:Adhesion G protein-coupled receptor L3-like n=1 Tax=Branchiostoma belcheri TaxID=7741 RepID=A0A6P4Z9V0_BRABE|nr:PREDICTED: adhesion G protein-coupled receptor L3-like [Branchiostoma belcheri]